MSKRSLNPLFTPTEPKEAPAAAAAPSLTGMYEHAADPGQLDRKPQQKPQGVYLTEVEIKYIQQIADEYGETRHGVMQYAVKELIRQWKRGRKPRVNVLGKLDKYPSPLK